MHSAVPGGNSAKRRRPTGAEAGRRGRVAMLSCCGDSGTLMLPLIRAGACTTDGSVHPFVETPEQAFACMDRAARP